ncbi:MAG TPA: DNA repair protein RadA [Actinomycetota bacterium]|nr:DNA repair protein RadA [Actinomycetota bacterium]
MSAAKVLISCTTCGYHASQWLGRCPQCGAWDSFARQAPAPHPASTVAPVGAPPVALAEVAAADHPRLETGIAELDRVLGGGLVRGSVALLAGEPGAGKSTLALQAAAGLERAGARTLLVCGEESVGQVAARARRLGGIATTQALAATDLATIQSHAAGYDVLIIDSIQTLSDAGLGGEPGSVTQVRGCASAVARQARESGIALLLVGHVTKDGAIAGPRVLEHLVDVVCTFEGDRGHSLRMLRATKNRFGGTAELGVFEMKAQGLVGVADASRLFLAERHAGVPGSTVGCVLEGRRPMAIEVQALVASPNGHSKDAPRGLRRRIADGLARDRLEVCAAVLERHAGILFGARDLFARIAGGFNTSEPAIDLPLALALASSALGVPVPPDVVAIGEVGLSGDVRSVPGLAVRLQECARLGFQIAVAGRSAAGILGKQQLRVVAISHLSEAVSLLSQDRPGP